MNDIQQEIAEEIAPSSVKSINTIYLEGKKSPKIIVLIFLLVVAVGTLFLPWTQNIKAKGFVTTLRQENRPQEINSVIAGRVVKWYTKEGDFVNAGDTIAQLSEIKDNYLDPDLLARTNDQINAKLNSINQYRIKVTAIENQILAMEQSLTIKTRQLKLKIASDSVEAIAADNDYNIAEAQLRRARNMNDSGLMSTMQLEQRIQSKQSSLAKKTTAANKFQNSKSEIVQILQEYNEKMYKARGEQASANSEIASAEAEISKLSNLASNYAIRNKMYYVVAPQSGQVIKAGKSGINEIIKEGEKIVEIVPTINSLAVEIFVPAIDLPLLSIGQEVKFLFDGYPAVVFSGWPQASYGIYSGNIVAIENNVNENGKFRILVAENRDKRPWPKSLKLGVGANSIALLKNVPIWYELWRNINGFPPDYYEKTKDTNKKYVKKIKKK